MTPAAPVPTTAREEWRRMWPLPLVAMCGVAGSSMFSYANGVLTGSVTREFGWTQANYSSGFSVALLVVVFVAPLVGRLIDRVGPRRMALAGIVPFGLGFAALSLANGSVLQWILLCLLQALCAAGISPVVWITAIVSRFNAGRGMALGVTQAGLGLATAVWPIVTAYYLQWFGWRGALVALGLTFAVPMLPLTFFLFRLGRDPQAEHAVTHAVEGPLAAERPKVASVLLTRTFVCLTLGGALFSMVALGFMAKVVPILQFCGFSLKTAAELASIAGLATLIGRLGIGVLLDRYPAKVIAIASFLTPIVPMLMLWQVKGSFAVAAVAVTLFGAVAGAESNVVSYVASRLLPRSIFASCYAIIIAVFAVFASSGPLIASALADRTGGFDAFLLLTIPLMIAGAILIAFIPPLAPPSRDATPATN